MCIQILSSKNLNLNNANLGTNAWKCDIFVLVRKEQAHKLENLALWKSLTREDIKVNLEHAIFPGIISYCEGEACPSRNQLRNRDSCSAHCRFWVCLVVGITYDANIYFKLVPLE